MSLYHPTPTRAISRHATSAVADVAHEPAADDPLLSFAPYVHKAPRRNSITPDKQRKFVSALAATGFVGQAVRGVFGGLSLRCLSPAGKSMEALYKLRNQPGAEGFAAAWDAAVERGVQRLEDTALARAIEGVPEWKTAPDGGLVTYGMKQNEALVMVFLRGRRSDRCSGQFCPGHPAYERIRAEVPASLYRAGRAFRLRTVFRVFHPVGPALGQPNPVPRTRAPASRRAPRRTGPCGWSRARAAAPRG